MPENAIYLSVIIPAYNEESNLPATLRDVAEYLKSQPFRSEVIVVDDGSTDRTREVAAGFSAAFPNLRVLGDAVNRGKGYAVKVGVAAAQGEFVLFMDADNSTRLGEVGKLIAAVEAGSDVAIGSRRVPGADVRTPQMHRVLLGNIYVLLTRMILGVKVRDCNCGFKLYRRRAGQTLFGKLTRHDWSFDSELLFIAARQAIQVKEVPVVWRGTPTSKVRPVRDGVRSFVSLLSIRWRAMQGGYQ